MKHRFARFSTVLSLLAASAFASTAALAQHKCDNPTTSIDKRACAKAAEDPEALGRFVWRTRAIWELYIPDYMPSYGEAIVIKPVMAKPAPTEAQVSKQTTAFAAR